MFREYEKSLEIMSQGQVILKLCKSSPNIPRGLVLGKPTESVGGASIKYLEVYSTIIVSINQLLILGFRPIRVLVVYHLFYKERLHIATSWMWKVI